MMKSAHLKPLLLLVCLLSCSVNAATTNAPVSEPAVERHYHTKTPYQPQQALSSYQVVPAGYTAVYTQMLARHGSRGMTGMKSDLAFYNLWLQAQKAGALTDLGKELGPDILKLMQANFLLGYTVPGISKPGYGNETRQGIDEHTELARRMHERLTGLFQTASHVSTDNASPRKILIQTSGKDRAVDSGYFFTQSLLRQQPGLQASIVYPASLVPREDKRPQSRQPGTDRFLLYFHKLSGTQDKVTDASDPLYPTYAASQAYQNYLKSRELQALEAQILAQPSLATAAHAVLAQLFHTGFITELEQGRIKAGNTGTYSFTSQDGKFTNQLTGDGETEIRSPVEAALVLYELYSAASNMEVELAHLSSGKFTAYMPSEQARVFAAADDAISFYSKGPGTVESADITYRMAGILLADFFRETDAVASGDLSHLAKLRFAHAEIMIPMASLLGIEGMSTQQPRNMLYQYSNNAWRGEQVAPMAANIQWDVYANKQGQTLVRMLYNERETAFRRDCDAAKISPGSYFYDYGRLKNCYQQRIPALKS